MMFTEPRFTEVTQAGDGFRVDIVYPIIRYMAVFPDKETAEKAQRCVEDALSGCTWEGVDSDGTTYKAKRRLLTGERPKLGVIRGGRE